MLPNITFLMCWVRSGGTLMNRCLGMLPNVVIMSEVHPLGGGGGKDAPKTIQDQALQWYDIKLNSTDFFDAVIELAEICEANNKHLILREYTRMSYLYPKDSNMWVYDSLRQICNVTAIALVRNPIDTVISYFSSLDTLYDKELHYIDLYTSDLLDRSIKYFRYEDFCNQPRHQMELICEYLGIDYDDSFMSYQQFDTVNGDVNFQFGSSRGLTENDIRLLPRRRISSKRKRELHDSKLLTSCCESLGYVARYDDPTVEIEPLKKYYSHLSKITRLRLINAFRAYKTNPVQLIKLIINRYFLRNTP